MEITIRAHRQFSRWRDFSVPNAFGQGMGCSKGALRGPSPRALNVQDGLGDLSEGTQSARSTYLDKTNRDPRNRDPGARSVERQSTRSAQNHGRWSFVVRTLMPKTQQH